MDSPHSGWALTVLVSCPACSAGKLTVGVEYGADDPQEQAHESETHSERPSSTESLDSEGDEDGSGDDLGRRVSICMATRSVLLSTPTHFDDAVNT